MATLRDIYRYLYKLTSFKREHSLTKLKARARRRRFASDEVPELWVRRGWRVIPNRAVPPELLYERGDNGGYMIPLTVKDERARYYTTTIELEMKRVPDYGWYPVKPMLDARECAALLGLALTTFYKVSVEFESRRKIRGLVSFDTQDLFKKDLRALDDLVEKQRGRRGIRPGAHAEYCVDPRATGSCPHADDCMAPRNHRGTCKDPRTARRRSRASSGWSREPRRPRTYMPCDPEQPTPKATTAATDAESPRQTWTEAFINETTSDPAERAALYAEQAADIAEERKSGRYVPNGMEVQ